ncbi:hypothetical protein GCM10018980_16170 [Streptomyces capoamus]|uniref:Uncharacterized protein n=1 Tax=Streptomyces capoamus TaxID=68183 RepID=A0A919C339_9ACTN|nr:hypothetical protein GCM10010501_18370 [Streptomyces libani subsp. rufus]GHG41222.1 hypothetical protein GCM10018980_16170 [Streptomyces capoamus]
MPPALRHRARVERTEPPHDGEHCLAAANEADARHLGHASGFGVGAVSRDRAPDEVKQPFPVVAHLGQDVDPPVLVWLDKLGETVGGVPAGADDRAVARKPVSTAMLDRQNQQDAAFAV